MVAGFGAPYVLLISLALKTAPASAAGSINPGMMAVTSLLLGWIIFRDRIGRVRIGGAVLILVGIALFTELVGSFTVGHLILMGTGIMWAIYALIVRCTNIPALSATAVVAIGSAVIYLPVYIVALPKRIAAAPLQDILMQAGFQGVLVSVLAIYAFNRSAELLGPLVGATLPALIPVTTLGLGVLLLGETVGIEHMVSAGAIGTGVALILAGHAPAYRLWRFVRARVALLNGD
ncbi:Permease of the drug/metabolite transporter (DMT) superfamily [Marinobacterium lacunae]|uniref:Permease of the drug/metabolite transporter (DMT) superfamily n=2 Tax=Marinobacterium lacunae TaxID=1232683 RepID=A0A081FVV9_9GAMM|nr:Permease of the drug/metabolite transporter (DMT) superfamily [Marinobacterium lacunae]